MKLRWAVLLAVLVAALAPAAVGAQAFQDSPTNPHFWHGAMLWILVSIFMLMGVGAASRQPFPTLVAGVVPLLIGVARGDISPLLVLLLVVECVSAAMIFIVVRR